MDGEKTTPWGGCSPARAQTRGGPAPTKGEWRSAMATLKVRRALRGVAMAMEARAAGGARKGGG
jgi:hypothetical protein